MSTSIESQMDAGAKLGLTPLTLEAIRRGLIQLDGGRIVYHVHKKKSYSIADPEEEVRADTIAFLVLEKGYDAERIETEVLGAHNNYADVVLYRDKRCTDVWLVVEDKKRDAPKSEIDEGEAQAFANSVALKATYALLDYGRQSALWQVEGYGAKERERNRLGDRDELPENYSEKVSYALYAGGPKDIAPADSETISTSVRRAHSIIWAGGKRDPLSAFDEWSKLMFAKVRDERYTPTGAPRGFQVGVGEPDSAVATRVHGLFAAAKAQDDALFPADERIELPDNKIAQVVRAIEGISFMHTDSDVIGTAFEDFFGSVFRGGLGQYFTMRPVARFVVAMLGPKATDFVLDPTCGSGGFLLETLLQVWNEADAAYAGQEEIDRVKGDFALKNVFGIEIHPTLARICKISLLLHHDGHTNIEADKSCLSGNLENPRLRKNSVFDMVVGNPPFGTKIERGDDDQLDGTSLDAFVVGRGRKAVQSEQVILERSVGWLKPGGLLGMVIPDGVLNNAGQQSNCPAVRDWLFRNGRILAVVSLPDFAFRRSGASNKTSVLVFEKYAPDEAVRLANALEAPCVDMPEALTDAGLDYEIFFAEASHIGYTPSGRHDPRNDLYTAAGSGLVAEDQAGSILGAWERWRGGAVDDPRCVTIPASEVWASHKSHRIDPKYHVYKAHARDYVPKGWSAAPLKDVVVRKRRDVDFSSDPMREYKVLTLSKTGLPRLREAGVGTNPPEWRGMYFADSSSTWYEARKGDIVYSGIDLWKGVVCYVSDEFDHALVTKEYPTLSVKDPDRVDPEFLAVLLRSKRFQKAFQAINTGHSNRRRTQEDDFGKVLVYLPPIEEQREIAKRLRDARAGVAVALAGVAEVEQGLDSTLQADDLWDASDEAGEE